MLQQFNAYKNHLAASGVKRRNKYEVRSAAAEALFLGGASLVALLRSYSRISAPLVPEMPSDSEVRRESRRRLRERREIPKFSLGKKILVDAEMNRVRGEIAAQRNTMEHQLNAALQRVQTFVEPFSSTVTDVLLADNLFPARWVGQSNRHGLVVLAFGGVEEMVWPEEMQVTKSGGVGVRKVTKDDLGRIHRKLLFRALLSTAKETLAANTGLERVTVVAVDGGASGKTLTKRDVWGFTTVDKRDLPSLASSDDLVLQLISLEETYRSAEFIDDESEYSFFSQLIQVLDALDARAQRLAERFMSSVFVKPAAKGTWLEPIGAVEVVFARDAGLLALFRAAKLPAPFEPEEAVNLASLDFWLSLG